MPCHSIVRDGETNTGTSYHFGRDWSESRQHQYEVGVHTSFAAVTVVGTPQLVHRAYVRVVVGEIDGPFTVRLAKARSEMVPR